MHAPTWVNLEEIMLGQIGQSWMSSPQCSTGHTDAGLGLAMWTQSLDAAPQRIEAEAGVEKYSSAVNCWAEHPGYCLPCMELCEENE